MVLHVHWYKMITERHNAWKESYEVSLRITEEPCDIVGFERTS